MKRIVLAILGFMALLTSQETFAQIGMGTENPDKSTVLDLVSTRRGLLIPRINIGDLNNASPVTAPANSLLVYNTNTTSGEGFYYWDGAKWVAITSDSNQLTSSVVAGDGVKVSDATSGNNTAYTVAINPGADGQYLVTYDDNGTLKTQWQTLPDILAELQVDNGLTYDSTAHTLKLGGDLEEPTTITTDGTNTLSIAGLQVGANTDDIVVMNANGTLKKISRTAMLDAKHMTLEQDVLEFTGTADGQNSVLEAVSIGIKDGGIGTTKITPGTNNQVLITNASGAVAWMNKDDLLGAMQAGTTTLLTGDGTVSSPYVVNVKPGTNNTVMTTDSEGAIVWVLISEFLNSNIDAKTLSLETDVLEFTQGTGVDAVLVEATIGVKNEGITDAKLATDAVTETKIKNGAVTKEKIQGEGNTQVLTTSSTGVVAWTAQSDLANKDKYTGVGAIEVSAGVANQNGGNDYEISVATAGTESGVVKQAATDAKVIIDPNGVLDINPGNIILEGDVTGPLNANKVVAIQNVGVDATAPTSNQVLQYDGTTWKATSLDASAITGEQLKSDGSITISNANNKVLLEELDIKIAPGTTKDQVLVTNDDVTGTEWKTVNEILEVENGLHKDDTTNKIHLGGVLVDETTTITTASDKKLAIAGLQTADDKANQYVVAEDATGVLRTVAKSLSISTHDIASVQTYSPHVPEIHVAITLGANDITMSFPDAVAAAGQTINIRITNPDENHDGYLNVLNTYGSIPYQGWIVKSNGSSWYIASRY